MSWGLHQRTNWGLAPRMLENWKSHPQIPGQDLMRLILLTANEKDITEFDDETGPKYEKLQLHDHIGKREGFVLRGRS